MQDKRSIAISRYLSKHLRHEPEQLGLTLALGGWVPVQELLDACAGKGFPLSLDKLFEVVPTNSKQRFSFDESRTLIRANQLLTLQQCTGTGTYSTAPKMGSGS